MNTTFNYVPTANKQGVITSLVYEKQFVVSFFLIRVIEIYEKKVIVEHFFSHCPKKQLILLVNSLGQQTVTAPSTLMNSKKKELHLRSVTLSVGW